MRVFRPNIPLHVADVIRHLPPDIKRGIKSALRALSVDLEDWVLGRRDKSDLGSWVLGLRSKIQYLRSNIALFFSKIQQRLCC